MSTQLRNQIQELTVAFTAQLMSALQTASLSDLAVEAAAQGGIGRGRGLAPLVSAAAVARDDVFRALIAPPPGCPT